MFLSYASQDAEAANRLAATLRAAGIEVWLDQSELRGGEAWDIKIRTEIAECALFVPIISAHTQARREGYFRLEWKLAAQRTHMMSERVTFLLPVVVDATPDAEADVPAEFRSVQWSRIGDDAAIATFAARIRSLQDSSLALSVDRRAVPPIAPVAGRRGRWFVAATTIVAGLAVIAALLAWRQQTAPERGNGSSSGRVLARVRELTRWVGIDQARLKTAEDLLRDLLKAEPENGEAWALAAKVDMFMSQTGLDNSEARKKSAIDRLARAVLLAPQSFEVRHVKAQQNALWFLSPETETLFRALLREQPDNREVLEELGMTVSLLGRADEACELLVRADRRLLAAYTMLRAGHVRRSLALIDEELAKTDSAEGRAIKADIQCFSLLDLDAAQATLAPLPTAQLVDEEVVGAVAAIELVRRDGRRLLDLLAKVPAPFVRNNHLNYPTGYLRGYGHILLEQPEAAALEWKRALQAVQTELAAQPDDTMLRGWEAVLHALLGEQEGAARALKLYASYQRKFDPKRFDLWYVLALVAAGGREDEVINLVGAKFAAPIRGDSFIFMLLRHSPEFDALRRRPEFTVLLAAYEKKLRDAISLPAGATPAPPARN